MTTVTMGVDALEDTPRVKSETRVGRAAGRHGGAVARRGIACLIAMDRAVLHVLRTRGHCGALERAALHLSHLGEHSRIWFSVALAGAVQSPAHRPIYVRLGMTLVATEVVTALAKLALDRPRPALPDLPPLMHARSPQSCPSAHASTSFAAARQLSQALPAPPLYLAACAMALTRPYLGVHYPSDVLAGMVLGTAFGELARR
jgi:membrane-associated phospholipid phosphatase